jgi:AmiR/NasT family two-component response regulator
VGSDTPEKRRHPAWEIEVRAAERLLGEAYAENAELRKRVESLQAALDYRDLIERAKGVIMGRLDVDAEEAWDLLHVGANGDLNGAQIAAAAVVAFRRTPAEIAATLQPETA